MRVISSDITQCGRKHEQTHFGEYTLISNEGASKNSCVLEIEEQKGNNMWVYQLQSWNCKCIRHINQMHIAKVPGFQHSEIKRRK